MNINHKIISILRTSTLIIFSLIRVYNISYYPILQIFQRRMFHTHFITRHPKVAIFAFNGLKMTLMIILLSDILEIMIRQKLPLHFWDLLTIALILIIKQVPRNIALRVVRIRNIKSNLRIVNIKTKDPYWCILFVLNMEVNKSSVHVTLDIPT